MNRISIRSVTPEDYEDICALNLELGYSYPEAKTKERIRHILDHTKDIILVAETDGKVTGYIHAGLYELTYCDPILNIMGFVVTEKLRGIGIGHLLMTGMEKQAKLRGFTGIRLTSADYRTGAHRFYKKHGFYHKKTSYNFVKDFNGILE